MRRTFTLMEVLLAMAIAAAAIALLSGSMATLARAKARTTQAHHVERLFPKLYLQVVDSLYSQKISWQQIEEGQEIALSTANAYGWHTYAAFQTLKKKPRKAAPKNVYLLEVTLSARDGSGSPIGSRTYPCTLLRHDRATKQEADEDDKLPDSDEQEIVDDG